VVEDDQLCPGALYQLPHLFELAGPDVQTRLWGFALTIDESRYYSARGRREVPELVRILALPTISKIDVNENGLLSAAGPFK
jgi:hypothetical protein